MIELPTESEPAVVVEGDAIEVLRQLPGASFDAVITDPPYPCIKRDYGMWTEAEWFALMDPVVAECRRVLKPTGSAVFILQPNSERVGRMRTWLWRFMADWGERWGVVQDAYWWNTSGMVLGGANKAGLMRPSVKPCVWLGSADCYRDQESCLWSESDNNRTARQVGRLQTSDAPSRRRSASEGLRDNGARMRLRAGVRGGTAPFNIFPVGSDGRWSGGTDGHPASTPKILARWWTRYICPPGGTVLDPFHGSGTMGVAAREEGRFCLGIERHPPYVAIARRRIAATRTELFTEATG